MSDNVELALRIAAAALFDLSAAWAVGLLLAGRWLRRSSGQTPQLTLEAPRLTVTAAVLLFALLAQLSILALTMADTPTFAAWRAALLPTAAMHSGRAIVLTAAAATLLLLCSLLRAPSSRDIATAAALVLVLAMHSALGHAAGRGTPSWLELLQFAHLVSMALWTGAVLVSGLWAAPRLAASLTHLDPGYLRALSRTAFWSVAGVLASGAIKGWIGTDGDVRVLWNTPWGLVLSAKLAFIAAALALGLLHKRWIDKRPTPWPPNQTTVFVRTLRVEALCLLAVLILSAALGNIEPA